MLIPLTRKTVEALIPAVATGDQYKHYWGKVQELLKRLLISVTALTVVLVIGSITRDNETSGFFRFLFGMATGLYWLWFPIYEASMRNRNYRNYPHGGLWQGEILDVYITEDLVGTEETVNKRGELVVVENRERRINLEVGDETGFKTLVQAPLHQDHKTLLPGMPVQLLLLSKEKNLSRISKISDAYLPNRDLWISDYPYLRRDTFIEVSRRILAEVARTPDDRPLARDRRGYIATPDRGYGNAGYDDRGYDDRGYDNRGYDDRDYTEGKRTQRGGKTRSRNDRPEPKGRRGYRSPGADGLGYDDRSYGDRGYGDRGYDTAGYDDRGYGDRDDNSRDYGDSGYENSSYENSSYENSSYQNPGYGDRGYDPWQQNDGTAPPDPNLDRPPLDLGAWSRDAERQNSPQDRPQDRPQNSPQDWGDRPANPSPGGTRTIGPMVVPVPAAIAAVPVR